MKTEARREERKAALYKRQVASVEVSPSMLLRASVELRENVLRAPPDVAPPSSYEELPAAQHCFWADSLLPDTARLQAPSTAAQSVDHAAAMAAAMHLYEQPSGSSGGGGAGGGSGSGSSSVLFSSTRGDFAVDKAMAELVSGTV